MVNIMVNTQQPTWYEIKGTDLVAQLEDPTVHLPKQGAKEYLDSICKEWIPRIIPDGVCIDERPIPIYDQEGNITGIGYQQKLDEMIISTTMTQFAFTLDGKLCTKQSSVRVIEHATYDPNAPEVILTSNELTNTSTEITEYQRTSQKFHVYNGLNSHEKLLIPAQTSEGLVLHKGAHYLVAFYVTGTPQHLGNANNIHAIVDLEVGKVTKIITEWIGSGTDDVIETMRTTLYLKCLRMCLEKFPEKPD